MNASSNEIWVDRDNYDDFETSRPVLFRDDMRDMFFKWFGIKPSDKVLDGGCATGVLTRFIAKGLDTGSVTGFDISRHFVAYGNKKIAEEGLNGKAEIVCEDGFNLSFADNTFDCVVNHTYLGVLSDPVAGLKEMVRVCKPGGRVSASSGIGTSWFGISWEGDSTFEAKERLNELEEKYRNVSKKIVNTTTLKQSKYWNSQRFPKLFLSCGLKNVMIHPYASGFSYNDSYWTDDFKKFRVNAGTDREIEIFEEDKKDPFFAENGFTNKDFDELILLYRQRQQYLLNNLDNDGNWDWSANLYFIVTGTK